MTTTARPQAPRYDDVIDLERYPIHDPASAKFQALVQACQDQLRDRGVAQLDGFLIPAAVSEMVALARQLAAQAWEIAIFDDGDELGWHFDNSEFSVTVMYCESEAGGHFDYCPGLRTENDGAPMTGLLLFGFEYRRTDVEGIMVNCAIGDPARPCCCFTATPRGR